MKKITARRAPIAAAAIALTVLLSLSAHAQETKLERVEITGSANKRIEGEGALPVQVITREDIVKQGLTTAAEFVSRISASANNLTDGGSIAYGGFRDQMGMNSANLRGIGVSSTLVLLNGRRMANFASPGDASGVDLNSIPAAAIQRVEVLLDGASVIYGSDAIGGVGDYGRDGFNIFGVLDLQKTGSLNANKRKFISDLNIPERLPNLLSSASFPGNIRLVSSQRDSLIDAGSRRWRAPVCPNSTPTTKTAASPCAPGWPRPVCAPANWSPAASAISPA